MAGRYTPEAFRKRRLQKCHPFVHHFLFEPLPETMVGSRIMARSGKFEYPVSPGQATDSGVAGIFQLFSDITSVRILYCLHAKESTLPIMSRQLKMPSEAVRAAVETLLGREILVSRTRGGKIYYRLTESGILRSLDLIHRVSQRKIESPGNISPAPRIDPEAGSRSRGGCTARRGTQKTHLRTHTD